MAEIIVKWKNTHDSNEDAKAALSLAKLKVEIFDHVRPFTEQRSTKLDILERLLQLNKTVLPLDETNYLKAMLKCKDIQT